MDERAEAVEPTRGTQPSETRSTGKTGGMPVELTMEELESYAPDTSVYLDAPTPNWLDELDLRPAPPNVKMGTHTIDASECLILDRFRDPEVALKNRLFDEQHDNTFVALPNADEASAETFELVSRFLTDHGQPAPELPPGMHPLEAAGRAVQEDLCLMIHRDGDWHLDAGALCFPTFWALADKIGKPTRFVHEYVAHYAEELSDKVDKFFDHLRPGRAVRRRNLSIKPYLLLYLPVNRRIQPVGSLDTAPDGSPWWLRSERQTLQRLPQSGAILFTIRLQSAPAKVFLDRPDLARDLAAMYHSWTGDQWTYKVAANDLNRTFIPWLEQISADIR